MDVVAQGPVAASTLIWHGSRSPVLTIVCKAVLDLLPGRLALRDDPPAPNPRDVPWEAPYGRTLRAPCDLVPIKPSVDVVLSGHAYAPSGRPLRSLVARLSVGGVDKRIEVWADRFFDRAGALREGPPFTRMPLVCERAAGGPGTSNPAGRPLGQLDAQGNVALPNLLPPGTVLSSPEGLAIPPVGFAPLPADWPLRVEKLGRRSPRDIPAAWEGQVVPDDIAREYFNAAPADQQVPSLREGETLTLENLSPLSPMLTCEIPALRPTATVEIGGRAAAVALRVDTLHLDTDLGTCTLVWRGQWPLRDPREVDRVVVALDAPVSSGRRARTHPGLAAPAAKTAESPLEGTMALGAVVARAALPFAGGTPPRSHLPSVSDPPVPPPPVLPPARVSPAPAAETEGPWARGAAKPTIGMAAVSGALALSAPKVDPLPEAPAPVERAPVQLLWFAADRVARIRRVRRWREILDAMEREPLDAEGGSGEPWEIEDRREVFEVLASGEAADLAGIEEAFAAAGRGGKLITPLVLLAGEVELPFDELATLRVAASTAAPLATAGDEGLRAAVEAADKLLGRPDPQVSPAVSEGLHLRIREAFAREKKGLPASYLEEQTARALLAGRKYQKREVLGGTFLRALVWLPGEARAVVGYLPEEVGRKVPMKRRFGARVIGEVHPRQEQGEGGAVAVEVVAVGVVAGATGSV